MWPVPIVLGSLAQDLTISKYTGYTEIHSVKHRLWETLGTETGAFHMGDAR